MLLWRRQRAGEFWSAAAARHRPTKSAAARRGRRSYLISHTYFYNFSWKNFCWSIIFCGCLVWNKYYKNRPSVTKNCKTMQAEVQIPSSKRPRPPTTVNAPTLSAYNALPCSKSSDDGVSRRRLMVSVRQRKVWWCAGCRRTLSLAVKNVGYFKKVTRFLMFMSLCLYVYFDCKERTARSLSCSIYTWTLKEKQNKDLTFRLPRGGVTHPSPKVFSISHFLHLE